MFNVNCGILGHIDSGKTSLCRMIHQVASTASMDKNPQSKERGITLDLGFSSLKLPASESGSDELQVTLVDCPGHAGLIRTVMNGARIIDMCILVVDAVKGFQTQTAECLIIAEILSPKLIIAVNKLDLLPIESRNDLLMKLTQKIRKTVGQTRFTEHIQIKPISCTSGEGTSDLLQALSNCVENRPIRSSAGPLHVAYDHCFLVKGQGTVFTGTILSGRLQVGQNIALPFHNETGEVKSIQKFHKPTTSAIQGDRVGICVPGINPTGKERGDIYNVNNDLVSAKHAVFLVKKVRYFKQKLGKGKLHMSIGHLHTMGTPYFFRARHTLVPSVADNKPLDTLVKELERDRDNITSSLEILTQSMFEYMEDVDSIDWNIGPIFCLIVFQNQLKFSFDSLLIASKLDLEENHPGCRIALYGLALPLSMEYVSRNVLRTKIKEGQIQRLHTGADTYLIKGILKKGDTNPNKFIGKHVYLADRTTSAIIEGPFGKSGLLKVVFRPTPKTSLIGETIYMQIDTPAFSHLVV